MDAELKQQSAARTVVVIDDDDVIRELLSMHLRNSGYNVLAAADAIDGGHLVLRSRPDVVICDVQMPYMTGYELVDALKRDPATKDIPIVFLSVADDVAEHAPRLGAVAHLRKPVSADRLLAVVGLYTA